MKGKVEEVEAVEEYHSIAAQLVCKKVTCLLYVSCGVEQRDWTHCMHGWAYKCEGRGAWGQET